MRVKIIKASEDIYWYSKHIGEKFEVEDGNDEDAYLVIDNNTGIDSYIQKDDCEIIEEENKYKELLRNTYLAYLRFDKALSQTKRDKGEIEVAYTWLDSCMSSIFDEIGDEITKK